jgi:hypothetical protein
MAWKEIAAISLLSLVVLLALPAASASSASLSDLKSTVSSFEDPRMNADDLAFYLVTHGINATPKGGYVEADMGGEVYKLTPNGSAPGLASIAA